MALIFAIDDHVARIFVATHVRALADPHLGRLSLPHQLLRGLDELRAAQAAASVALRMGAHEDREIFQVPEAAFLKTLVFNLTPYPFHLISSTHISQFNMLENETCYGMKLARAPCLWPFKKAMSSGILAPSGPKSNSLLSGYSNTWPSCKKKAFQIQVTLNGVHI